MRLAHVPPQFVDTEWKLGASHLAQACATSGGEVTGDQLKMLLSRGERSLVRMEKDDLPVGWGVYRVDQLPNVRALHICEVWAPCNLHEEFFRQIAEFAKANGCSEVRCAAKPAHARLYRMRFGFESLYETLRVPL